MLERSRSTAQGGDKPPHHCLGSPLRARRRPVQKMTYPPFRASFFHDPAVNPVLKGEGWKLDRLSCVRDSRRLWTTNGPSISVRLPKTAVAPGTAFRNECLSADQLYSSNRNSLGYEAHRSLRGTSLCSTTKRFQSITNTPERVGPGSYNVTKQPRGIATCPPSREEVEVPERLEQWGNAEPDTRAISDEGSWKITSEIPSPTTFSFRRAPCSTWIDDVAQRQHKFNPEARRSSPVTCAAAPEQRLPHFIQGLRSPVHTKKPPPRS